MNKKSIKNIFKEIYLFKNMTNEELEQLTKICSLHNYKKDSYLFMAGDTSEHLLILTEGSVSVFKHDEKGNNIPIGFFTPFSLLAEPAILKGIPFPSTAIFKSDGSVMKLKLNDFKKLFMSNPHISYEIIQSLLDKIQLLQNNIHLNIASSAKEKVLNFYKNNQNSNLELKQYEIASLLGMTAETFSRSLNSLLKEAKLTKTTTGYHYN